MNEKTTKHKVKEPEMRAEYDFSGGIRGKYYKRYVATKRSLRARAKTSRTGNR